MPALPRWFGRLPLLVDRIGTRSTIFGKVLEMLAATSSARKKPGCRAGGQDSKGLFQLDQPPSHLAEQPFDSWVVGLDVNRDRHADGDGRADLEPLFNLHWHHGVDINTGINGNSDVERSQDTGIDGYLDRRVNWNVSPKWKSQVLFDRDTRRDRYHPLEAILVLKSFPFKAVDGLNRRVQSLVKGLADLQQAEEEESTQCQRKQADEQTKAGHNPQRTRSVLRSIS